MGREKKKPWIQKAIKREGALTQWLKRGGARIVASATKKPVWTKKGDINTTTLKSFRNTKAYEELPTTIKRRINLAITLQRLASKKKK